ncbi:hypothetical protein IB286_02370 [Spongiibacter sp. KMU-158]|uniref:DUF4398 domain-containing protein n=1 Tax=Spongiibacter pelagi TaxID=2760804 RepID=A0A927GUQ5_9GAMM|nr:hypothetical protein [Spongiibacter pelagi]MBD2857836.1 hypothetical protein [Spongiibacter pelagi]
MKKNLQLVLMVMGLCVPLFGNTQAQAQGSASVSPYESRASASLLNQKIAEKEQPRVEKKAKKYEKKAKKYEKKAKKYEKRAKELEKNSPNEAAQHYRSADSYYRKAAKMAKRAGNLSLADKYMAKAKKARKKYRELNGRFNFNMDSVEEGGAAGVDNASKKSTGASLKKKIAGSSAVAAGVAVGLNKNDKAGAGTTTGTR